MTVRISPQGSDDNRMNKKRKNSVPAGVGFALGMVLGAAIGLALKNLALGVGVGVAFALSLEAVFRTLREKDGN